MQEAYPNWDLLSAGKIWLNTYFIHVFVSSSQQRIPNAPIVETRGLLKLIGTHLNDKLESMGCGDLILVSRFSRVTFISVGLGIEPILMLWPFV